MPKLPSAPTAQHRLSSNNNWFLFVGMFPAHVMPRLRNNNQPSGAADTYVSCCRSWLASPWGSSCLLGLGCANRCTWCLLLWSRVGQWHRLMGGCWCPFLVCWSLRFLVGWFLGVELLSLVFVGGSVVVRLLGPDVGHGDGYVSPLG